MAQYANPVVAERGRKYSSELVAPGQRKAWLCEVIGREYAEVDIVPPTAAPLYNEMTLYPWQDMQLSVIHSNSLTIQRDRGAMPVDNVSNDAPSMSSTGAALASNACIESWLSWRVSCCKSGDNIAVMPCCMRRGKAVMCPACGRR